MIMKLLSPRLPLDVRGLKQKNVVNAISIDDVPALTLARARRTCTCTCTRISAVRLPRAQFCLQLQDFRRKDRYCQAARLAGVRAGNFALELRQLVLCAAELLAELVFALRGALALVLQLAAQLIYGYALNLLRGPVHRSQLCLACCRAEHVAVALSLC